MMYKSLNIYPFDDPIKLHKLKEIRFIFKKKIYNKILKPCVGLPSCAFIRVQWSATFIITKGCSDIKTLGAVDAGAIKLHSCFSSLIFLKLIYHNYMYSNYFKNKNSIRTNLENMQHTCFNRCIFKLHRTVHLNA